MPVAILQAYCFGGDKMNGANTAWIMTSTALVLFMTLPGLALFYGGLVRSRNVLSVFMQCFAIACLASVLWLVIAYSLAFSGTGAILGDFRRVLYAGVARDALWGDIPESVFFMFQMTFAIITPALIVGAYVERIKFAAVLLISGLWLVVVYAPVAHWVWGGGWLGAMGVLDFAGGLVVHLTAGVAAVVIAVFLGHRRGFPADIRPPHSPGMTMMGAAMLWVGWFGFNGGSALAANADAGMAIAVTHISAAVGSLVWLVIEWIRFGKPSLIGLVTGTIAGLATITPASGFVGPGGALIIGLVGGVICYIAVDLVKKHFRVDDSLDVLAVHGVGGVTGTILVAIFVDVRFGGVGLADGATIASPLGTQFVGVIAILIWTLIATTIIVILTRALVGLRVDEDDELQGLDITSHGETGYNL